MSAARSDLGWAGRLLLVLGSLLLCFGLLEVTLRVMAADEAPPAGDGMVVPSENPRLVYELRPDFRVQAHGVEVRTNAAGFRDQEFERSKAPGVFRIAVVGDSVTFGFGVEEEQAFPQQLERRLRETGRSVEVLNFGVPGYNSLQEVELIRSRVLAYDPDLILIGYVLNDHKQDDRGALTRFFRSYRSLALGWLWTRTRGLYRRLIYSVTAEAFEELSRLGREHEVPVAVAVFPMMKFRDDGSYRYHWRHESVREVSARVGFPTLDMFEVFQDAGFEELRLDRVHPNPRGHRLAAERIHDFLEREGLLP